MKSLDESIAQLEHEIESLLCAGNALLERASEFEDLKREDMERLDEAGQQWLHELAQKYRAKAAEFRKEAERSRRLIQKMRMQKRAAWN